MTVIFTHGNAVADVQGRPQQAADFFTSSQATYDACLAWAETNAKLKAAEAEAA